MGSGCSRAHADQAQPTTAAVHKTECDTAVIQPAVDRPADEAHVKSSGGRVDPGLLQQQPEDPLNEKVNRGNTQDDALRPPSPLPRSHTNPLDWPSDGPALLTVQRERSADTPLVRLVTLSSGASRSANEPFSTSQSLRGPHSTGDFPAAAEQTTATTASPRSSATGSESATASRAAKERDPPLANSRVSSWTSSTCRQFALLAIPSPVDDVASAALAE